MELYEFSFKKINKKLTITPNYFDYPVGSIFRSKVKAVYHIFDLNIKNYFHKEFGQIDSSLMHGIERIWAYIAKLNNFCYKNILSIYNFLDHFFYK